MNGRLGTLSIVFSLISAVTCWAEAPLEGGTGIRITGRSEVVVTEPIIRLGNVVQIESSQIRDDESIVQLRKIPIGASPKCGETVKLEGVAVLERLKAQGVRLDQLRYTLPREIAVTRAYREISILELERAVSFFLGKTEKPVELRKLLVEKPVRIPADSSGVEVVGLQVTKPGHIGIDFHALSESEDIRFQLGGFADEWRLLPAAAKPLVKGAIITAGDVELKRMNGTSAGRDVIENIGDIVGHSLIRDVGEGEMFRQNNVIVPPVIKAGTRVTLLFRQEGIEATATGVAAESGIAGQDIKVRNDTSKKIVVGRVMETGLVNVGADFTQ
jgi:flagella basal body P-ring formation protein FlgA